MNGEHQTDLARRISELSVGHWGKSRPTVIVGRARALVEAQCRLLQFAQAESPVLISGETGTGKELFARALYLLSVRRRQPFLCVNCAQYQDGQLLASELFGHRKGSFTGALVDRPGVFEDADRGVVFLDEVAELPLSAQAMLLRTLSEGEVLRVGESRARQVNVRVVAATARSLQQMVADGKFREDLFYRLRFLRLRAPALRERAGDIELLADHFLDDLNRRCAQTKRFSNGALACLKDSAWPGNIRQLRSVVDVAFHTTDDAQIETEALAAELESEDVEAVAESAAPRWSAVADDYGRMTVGGECFWQVVYAPFMARDLNRAQVRRVIAKGLTETRGSYKDLLELFRIASEDYLKFMDFLRHQRLKPH